LSEAINKLEHTLSEAINKLEHILSEAINKLEHTLSEAINKLKHTLSEVINKLGHTQSEVINKLKSQVETLSFAVSTLMGAGLSFDSVANMSDCSMFCESFKKTFSSLWSEGKCTT